MAGSRSDLAANLGRENPVVELSRDGTTAVGRLGYHDPRASSTPHGLADRARVPVCAHPFCRAGGTAAIAVSRFGTSVVGFKTRARASDVWRARRTARRGELRLRIFRWLSVSPRRRSQPHLERSRLRTGLSDSVRTNAARSRPSFAVDRLWRDGTRNAEGLASFLFGFVAVASDRANHFERLDADRAQSLIPAFKAAFRQAVPEPLSRIHPSVEWRFLQEAERRSLGLPAEPIVFAEVYPMYAISEVRSSASERNLAIQTDLLEQFNLALAVVEAARQERQIGFLEQLAIDLQLYADRLSREIKAEDEVGALDYLKKHFEVYFDYFRQCGSSVLAAVETYEQACANEHRSVSEARDRYNRALNALNAHLQATWERHQEKMQQILPHYCDLEVADGIKQTLYVGASIDPQFSLFHLHSLRYDRLRAVCDCARTCLELRDGLDLPLEVSHLVLAYNTTVDLIHDEKTDKLLDARDTRYAIANKRIDKARDAKDGTPIAQPGMLTVVYST
jgi:hypothetical protein